MDIKIVNEKARDFIPKYATPGAAGFDFHSITKDDIFINPGQTVKFPTGFAMTVPEGHMLMGAPRSGLGINHGIVLGNLVAIIDHDYTGEIVIALWNRSSDGPAYKVSYGDRICQGIIVPVTQVEFNVVDELKSTVRGSGGFGSTGS